jgi:hypothetical protein
MEQKWYWIILFFPLIGSLFYLYDQFYSRRNVESIKETIKETMVDNYSINKLEQQAKFAPTYANILELAEEHLKAGNLDRAEELFQSRITDGQTTDPHLNMSLLKISYLKKDYEEAIKYAQELEGEKEFKNSEEMIAYAWSLFRTGKVLEADKVFKIMDSSFCNYTNRLEYAYFLQESLNNEVAKTKVEELITEIDDMDSYEKRLNKKVIRQIRQLYKTL